MPAPTEITISQLDRLIGLPNTPTIVDVRLQEDYEADPRLIPGSLRRDFATTAQWASEFAGRKVIAVCQKGLKISQGVAAWLRHLGIEAETLEGGYEAWRAAGEPLISASHMTKPTANGHTLWVTRARPKIDRIACPWLIRRFVDPGAVFLFVSPSEVLAVADRFSATPFDVEDVFWSHRGDRCTFDTMLEEFALDTPPLRHLAKIIRGADTARPGLAPEAAGLLAVSLGYSRMFRDDLEQLSAAMSIYDALYRWCREAREETHNWPTVKAAG